MSTKVIDANRLHGTDRVIAGRFTFSNPYTSGGEALTKKDLGLERLYLILFDYHAGGYLVEYDYTNEKFKVRYPTKSQAAANTGGNAPTTPALSHTAGVTTVTSSGATMPDHAAGGAVSVPSGFRSAVDAGVGEEVGAINLSALTIRFVAIGI